MIFTRGKKRIPDPWIPMDPDGSRWIPMDPDGSWDPLFPLGFLHLMKYFQVILMKTIVLIPIQNVHIQLISVMLRIIFEIIQYIHLLSMLLFVVNVEFVFVNLIFV
jgi:hypothetical protein